jgi:hypothetical protein
MGHLHTFLDVFGWFCLTNVIPLDSIFQQVLKFPKSDKNWQSYIVFGVYTLPIWKSVKIENKKKNYNFANFYPILKISNPAESWQQSASFCSYAIFVYLARLNGYDVSVKESDAITKVDKAL